MSDTDYLERRHFFRVEDELIIQVQPINKDDKLAGIQRLKKEELTLPDVSRLYLSLESSLQDHLDKIRDLNLKSALSLLNRKLNLLAHGGLVSDAYQSLMSKPRETVSLSASGVGLYSNQAWEIGDDCAIELILLPSKTYLFAYGHMANCKKVEQKATLDESQEQIYLLGAIFDFMREEDMERLIQHIMRVEAQLIREARRL